MRVSQEERTAGRPQLTPERVGGAQVFVGTVKSVTKAFSKQKDDDQYILEFKEVDDAIYRLNVTNLNLLCERFGDDTDKWIGEQVPLVKTTETLRNSSKSFVVYQVAPLEDWKELLGEGGKARRSRR